MIHYGFIKKTRLPFEDAITIVSQALKKEGLGDIILI